MLMKPKHISVDAKENRFWNIFISSQIPFIALISILFAVWASSDALAYELNKNSNYSLEEGIQEDVTVTSSTTVINLAHDANRHPFGPNIPEPTPENESDGSDEDEKEDSLDDEWGNTFTTATLHDIAVEKNQSFHLRRGLQNRTVRPLFMLYHSWKNFIS